MPQYVLYDAPQSTCSQRVRFVLNAKGLPFNEVVLDLFAGDQLKPDYLAINPNGVVPTLVHRAEPVTDSSVIIEYLDELSPFPDGFRPFKRIQRAKMRSLMRYIDEVPTPAIRVPSYNLAFLPHFRSMSEDEFRALADSKPLRREFLLAMGRTGFPEQEMEAATARLARSLEWMNDAIESSGGPWLMGDGMTLADIAVMPVVVRMADIGLDRMWSSHPRIQVFLENFRQHPAYEPTFYYGSLLTEKYPHLSQALVDSASRSN